MTILADDDSYWQAVTERDTTADGAFVYAVRTTGVFCRPSCGARKPLRKNVSFYAESSKARLAGFRAPSRFYESAMRRHGMTAINLRTGACGIEIRYAFGKSTLGLVAVAATDKGICAVLFGATREELAADLQDRFPKAVFEVAHTGSDFEQWVEQTLDYLDGESSGFDLPLDVRGTAFQELVWRALRDIPQGQTATYTEVAERIGHPKSARAVAGACGANAAAVVIPCHRVIRTDGSLSGYRWGTHRKRALLERESDR